MDAPNHTCSLGLKVVWPLNELQAVLAALDGPKAVVIGVDSTQLAGDAVSNSGLAATAVRLNVTHIAIVGSEAERLHDALDWSLEQAGAENVVTTWHDEAEQEDAVTCVTTASIASGIKSIVLLSDTATEAGALLVSRFQSVISTWRQHNYPQ